jgi:hypothetical protein
MQIEADSRSEQVKSPVPTFSAMSAGSQASAQSKSGQIKVDQAFAHSVGLRQGKSKQIKPPAIRLSSIRLPKTPLFQRSRRIRVNQAKSK